jgi:hypothetical protein
MLHVVGEYLADMNAGSKKPQHLVLFQFALEHVARISAVVSQPGTRVWLTVLLCEFALELSILPCLQRTPDRPQSMHALNSYFLAESRCFRCS